MLKIPKLKKGGIFRKGKCFLYNNDKEFIKLKPNCLLFCNNCGRYFDNNGEVKSNKGVIYIKKTTTQADLNFCPVCMPGKFI